MLKKEFKRKDVDRARNLLTGKSGASSETQVGYKKKRIECVIVCCSNCGDYSFIQGKHLRHEFSKEKK